MNKFTPEDAWFLLSVKYAQGNNDSASIEEVIRAGDFINHAILLDSEIEHAISTLTTIQLLEVNEGQFKLGSKFNKFWESSGAEKHRPVHKQLELLENKLIIT